MKVNRTSVWAVSLELGEHESYCLGWFVTLQSAKSCSVAYKAQGHTRVTHYTPNTLAIYGKQIYDKWLFCRDPHDPDAYLASWDELPTTVSWQQAS